MRGCNFGIILAIDVSKSYRGKFQHFRQKSSKYIRYLPSGTSFVLFRCGDCWSYEDSQSRKTQSQRKLFRVKVSRRTQKVEIYLAKERSGLAFFSTDRGHSFARSVGTECEMMLTRKGPLEPKIAGNFVRIHSVMIYTDLTEWRSMAIWTNRCSDILFLFQSSRLQTLYPPEGIWTIRLLVTYNSDRY